MRPEINQSQPGLSEFPKSTGPLGWPQGWSCQSLQLTAAPWQLPREAQVRNFRMDKGKGHLLHFSGRKPESEVCQAGRANPAVQRNHQHFNQQNREQRSGHPSGPVDLLLVGGFNMEVLHRPIWNNTFLLDWFLRTSMMVEKGQGPGIVKSEQHAKKHQPMN